MVAALIRLLAFVSVLTGCDGLGHLEVKLANSRVHAIDLVLARPCADGPVATGPPGATEVCRTILCGQVPRRVCAAPAAATGVVCLPGCDGKPMACEALEPGVRCLDDGPCLPPVLSLLDGGILPGETRTFALEPGCMDVAAEGLSDGGVRRRFDAILTLSPNQTVRWVVIP